MWIGSVSSNCELSALLVVLYIVEHPAGTPVAILRATRVEFWQRVNGENKQTIYKS